MSLKVIEEADWLRKRAQKLKIEYEPTDWIESGPREHRNRSTVARVLIAAWLLGFFPPVAMGGFIHILLVVAVILISGGSFGKRE